MEKKDALYQRIDILLGAEILPPQIAADVKKIVDEILQKQPEVTLDKLEMFVTHLAMAAARLEKGEPCEALDPSIAETLEFEPTYEKAKEWLGELLLLQKTDFPESEKTFLLMHMCNLLEE